MRSVFLSLIVALLSPLSATAGKDSETFRALRHADKLEIYRSVRQLPDSYKESLKQTFEQKTLEIAEPGADFRTGDFVDLTKKQKPLPTRRLVFAAGNERLRLFYYEVGGYGGGGCTVLVFRCYGGHSCERLWTGVDFARKKAHEPNELIRRILAKEVQFFDSP